MLLPTNHVLFFLLAVCLASLAGCRPESEVATEQEETFISYAELPGLAATHHPPLKAEYALLKAERATPKLLDEDAAETTKGTTDLRKLLTEQFNTSAIDYALERSEKSFEGSELKWDSVTMVKASQLGQQYEDGRAVIRKAITDPSTHLSTPLSQGIGLDVAFVDAAILYHRLETFHAANQLTQGDVNGALKSLEAMAKLSLLLGQQKHVVSRLTAARCRREGLNIVAAIASNPATTDQQWQALKRLVEWQLVGWPHDADAWIGDRAQGLHMYEMIRDGHLLSVLTGEELKELSQGRSLDAFHAAAVKSIDDDQAFYLQAMRDVIAACDAPFHRRQATFDQLRKQLSELQKTPEYPLIADRLLLQGIEDAQQQQALDRAWMEAWANALTLAVEDRAPVFQVNPASGRDYEIAYESGRVIVSRIDPENYAAQVVVPLRRARAMSSGVPLPPPR